MLERFLERIDFENYDDFKKNYKLTIPENFNFGFDIIDEWAYQDPGKPALVWCNDDGDEKRYTFEEVRQMSNRAVNMFKSKGIKKGDTVMLILKQRPEVWFLMIALHKLGAVVIPASYLLTPKDIVYRCEAADIKMICLADDPEVIKHVSEALPDCPTVKYVSVLGADIPNGWCSLTADLAAESPEYQRPEDSPGGHDPMLLYFSSGTTGMPKMVLHDYHYPLGHITTAKYWQHVEDGGLHLTIADSGWGKFGWSKIYGQWVCGAVMVGYDTEKFNPVKTLETMERLKLTTFCAPPTVYRFLIQEDLSKYDFSSIHHAETAGEPLNPEVYNRFKEATGLEIHEGFGQTETTVMLANYGWDKIKPGSTGKPAPLLDLDIVDAEGNSCEPGVVGSIVIRNMVENHPAGLFTEYYRDAEAMEKSVINGVYYTGDTGWKDEDGYYWFVGRNDDVIKCSGYRIGPFEVESALLTHPSVIECAITAVPDPIRGQVVKATIVLTKDYEPSDELTKELQDHVKRVTAPYKYPRVVEYVDELPKTSGGKIRRVEIRQKDYEKNSEK